MSEQLYSTLQPVETFKAKLIAQPTFKALLIPLDVIHAKIVEYEEEEIDDFR